jgi:membrane-bound lytic murein transglycosylase MltF
MEDGKIRHFPSVPDGALLGKAVIDCDPRLSTNTWCKIMLEVYTGRRGLTVTVADPAVSAARYQADLMEGGTGWFRVCRGDCAITLVPTGLVPLTFETEGNVVLESAIPTQESRNEPHSDLLRHDREGTGKPKSTSWKTCVEKYEVTGVPFFPRKLRPNMPSSAKSTAKLFLLLLLALATSCGRQKKQSDTKTEPAAQPAATEQATDQTSESVNPSLLERIRTERWTGDVDEMVKRRYIRALVVYNKTNYFYDGVQARGITFEALREFQKYLNDKLNTGKTQVQIVFIPVRRDHLLQGIAEGRGDIAASDIAITAHRKKSVAFSDPVRADAKQIVVTAPSAAALSSVDDLSGKEVYVRRSSHYWETLSHLNDRLKQAGKPEIILKAADEHLEDEDILDMVHADLVPITVMDDLLATFWSQVYGNIKLRPDLTLATDDQIAWAVNHRSPNLLALVNEFVKGHKVGTAFGNTLLQRYLKNTQWVTNNTSNSEVKRFRETVDLFKKYGRQYDFDWLILEAQAYQESHIDQSARSPSGAVGVMQIKPSTAAGKPIYIQGVENSAANNIHAGVKYLRFITDQYFKNDPMDHLNKELFAFASYNAGPARIAKLRRQAAREGFDPNQWFNNVEVVAAKEIGRETVMYVDDIYKYYVAYSLVAEHHAMKRKKSHLHG